VIKKKGEILPRKRKRQAGCADEILYRNIHINKSSRRFGGSEDGKRVQRSLNKSRKGGGRTPLITSKETNRCQKKGGAGLLPKGKREEREDFKPGINTGDEKEALVLGSRVGSAEQGDAKMPEMLRKETLLRKKHS